jgi:hypothetical protein
MSRIVKRSASQAVKSGRSRRDAPLPRFVPPQLSRPGEDLPELKPLPQARDQAAKAVGGSGRGVGFCPRMADLAGSVRLVASFGQRNEVRRTKPHFRDPSAKREAEYQPIVPSFKRSHSSKSPALRKADKLPTERCLI